MGVPTQNLRISVNLNGLRGRLWRSLQRTILLVAAGLQNLDELDAEFLELPTDFRVQFDPNLKWTKEEAKEQYTEWTLSNGFRDAIETVGGVLEEAHQVLSVWELYDTSRKNIKVSGSEWNEIIVQGGRRFQQFGLPDKLKHIAMVHNLPLDEQISSHLLCINKARNCLVHRNGIVTKRDVTADAELQVTWRKMGLFLKNENGEKPLRIGAYVEKESIVGFRLVDVCRSFALGGRIVFSVEEFAEICWSLIMFGEDLVKKMNVYGIENGFLTSTEMPE